MSVFKWSEYLIPTFTCTVGPPMTYDAISKAGIEVIVQPSFWLGSPRNYVGSFEDYWEHMI